MKVFIYDGNRLLKTKTGKAKFFRSKKTARKYLYKRGITEKEIGGRVKLIADFNS